jgi:GNAT superfamily N-acetyltransferase
MLKEINIEGRPALAAFLNDQFEPVEQSDATMLKAHFTDEAGGVVFLTLSFAPEKAFDPSQPRDEEGKWTSGGGAAPASAPAKPAGKKKPTKADFDKAKINLRVIDSQQDAFLDKWAAEIGEDPASFKQTFMGGLSGPMSVSFDFSIAHRGALAVKGEIESPTGENIGNFDRIIDINKKTAKSSLFEVHKRFRGSDIGKKLLAGNVEMYEKIGIEKVTTFANIDVGGYAWAKYGYVPTQSDWNELRNKLIARVEGRPLGSSRISSGSGEYPGDWDSVTSDNQDRVRDEWFSQTRDEFIESEQNNYYESGSALDDTKTEMAHDWSGREEWAVEALEEYREPDDGIPYTNEQILKAVSIEYESDGEGRNDPEITFDDDRLREPIGGPPPGQGTLPGIEPEDLSQRLTEAKRDEISAVLTKAFNKHADDNYSAAEVPSYVFESINEYQEEHWSMMDDRERFRFAERNNLLDEVEIEDDEDEDEQPVEADEAQESDLLKALRNPDPKSIWKVADSPQGKSLLLGKSWSGVLNLKDPESMARFKAYVGKVKAHAGR